MSYCSESSCWYWVSQTPASVLGCGLHPVLRRHHRGTDPALRCCGARRRMTQRIVHGGLGAVGSLRPGLELPKPLLGQRDVEAACRCSGRQIRGVARRGPAAVEEVEMFPICWRRLARSNAGSSSGTPMGGVDLGQISVRQQRSRNARRPWGCGVVRAWTRASLRQVRRGGSLNFQSRQRPHQPKPPVG